MNKANESWRQQGRAEGLYDEQLQRIQQEKKLLRTEAEAKGGRCREEVE